MRFSVAMTLVVAFSIASERAHAVIVAQYDFTGSSLNSSDTNLDSTASAFSTVGMTSVIELTIGNPAPGIYASAANIDSGPISTPATKDYYSFTVTPIATSLDYTTLTMDVRAATTKTGNYDFSLQTSLNNFTTNIATFIIVGGTSATTFQNYSFDLSAFSSSAVAQEFRIVLRDDTSTASAGLVFDNVTLNTVPEPTTAVLVLGTLAAGMLLCRRRSNPSSSDALS